MGYLAIYRKYRPQTFDKVIGQDHVVTTLINQIKSDRIGHAYLFTGTRGTGKTSIAKIFAKAINCLHPVNGSPCGKCSACLALLEQSNIDILEIDAASNNGVNEIRDLREKVQYPPVNCRYKVYIIDEVHMLSPSAFNALLKTLEEPPKHAVFILATTEVHKMPATILSRCMRFDFKLVDVETIAKLISDIYDDLNKEYDIDAVNLIAKAGEGSVRDALSIADTCLSSCNGKLSYKEVLTAIGASDRGSILAFITALCKGDAGEVFRLTDEVLKAGKSIGLMIKDVLSTLRELLVVKTTKSAKDILKLPDDMINELKAVADITTKEKLLRASEIYADVENSLKYSNHPRILFETASIKATRPDDDYDFDALLTRVYELEKRLADVISNGTVARNTTTQEIKVEEKAIEKTQELAPKKVEEPIKTQEVGQLVDSGLTAGQALGRIIQSLRKNNEIMLWSIMQSTSAKYENNALVIYAGGEGDEEIIGTTANITLIKAQLPYQFEVKVKPSPKVKEINQLYEEIGDYKKIFGDDIVIVE